MTRSRLLTILFALIVLAGFTPETSAHYDPSTGRWFERDPIARVNVAPLPPLAPLAVEPLFRSSLPYVSSSATAGTGEYLSIDLYLHGPSSEARDPTGLVPIADEDPDPAGWGWGGPSASGMHWEDWLEEYDRQMACCTCLLYAETRGQPGCMDALVWIMHNRWNTGWPEHRKERSFCAQANLPAFQGGVNNPAYQDCRTCKPDLPKPDQDALVAAEAACKRFLNGTDPTGGAQYWWAPGATPPWMKGGQVNSGNCVRVYIAGCTMEIWRCKERPLAIH